MIKWLFECFGKFAWCKGETMGPYDKPCFECQDVGVIESVQINQHDSCMVVMKVMADEQEFCVECKLAMATMTGGLRMRGGISDSLRATIPDPVPIDVLNDGTDISVVDMDRITAALNKWVHPEYYITDPRLLMMGFYVIMPEDWVASHQNHIPTREEAIAFLQAHGIYWKQFTPDFNQHQLSMDPYEIMEIVKKEWL